MKSSEYLRKAKALIDSPEKWTKNAFARNSIGDITSLDNPDSVCFCVNGAINKILNLNMSVNFKHIKRYVIFNLPLGVSSISQVNDYWATSHKDVMIMFDRAIELAESEGD